MYKARNKTKRKRKRNTKWWPKSLHVDDFASSSRLLISYFFSFCLSSLFLLYSSCFLSSFLFLLLSCRFAFAKQQHAVFKYRFLTALCAALSSSFFQQLTTPILRLYPSIQCHLLLQVSLKIFKCTVNDM